MRRRLMAGMLLLALALCALAGCAGNEVELTRYQAQFLTLFDTATTIIGYAEDEESFTQTAQYLHDELEEYHQLYDIYNSYEGVTNIKSINDAAGVAPVQVDERILDLLEMSLELYQQTGGKVNVAMGSVLSIWHDYREAGINDPENARLPDQAELEQAAQHTDLSQVVIDREAGTVYLPDPEMSLDVGAVAKGYAVEQVCQGAEEEGYDHLLVSVGGNVRAIGERADGTDWQVGIQNPDTDSDQALWCTVDISGPMAVVTSGVYQRYYTVDGQRYHHIINPDTLFPGENFQAVSILSEDSGLADALSTAVFNLSAQEGLAFIESLDGVEALWILSDGSEQTSSGFDQYRQSQS